MSDRQEPHYMLLSQAEKDKDLRRENRKKASKLIDRTVIKDREILKQALGLEKEDG